MESLGLFLGYSPLIIDFSVVGLYIEKNWDIHRLPHIEIDGCPGSTRRFNPPYSSSPLNYRLFVTLHFL